MGAREILESTYHGLANVYHYPQTEIGGIVTEGERTVLYEDLHCALSRGELRQASPVSGVEQVQYTAKLFCAPEVVLPAGCEMEIRQDGMTYLFRHSGEAFKYESHQEITLERLAYA